MTRLIDADALKKAINDNGCRHSHYFDVFDEIDNAPTVEPEKGIKRVNNDANFDDNIAPFFCSKCLNGVEIKDRFCWFCGAEMEEETNDV